MQKIAIPYGSGSMSFELPDEIRADIIDMEKKPVAGTDEEMIKHAMDNPIGAEKLEEIVVKGDKIAIVVNDHTRPGPTRAMLNEIVSRLEKKGIPEDSIKIVVATGSHRAPTEVELDNIIGKENFRFAVESHDCMDDSRLTYMGETESGLPIYINTTVAKADVCITTGLIAPHPTAGFSGGRKSIVPGVSGIGTLKKHHSPPIRPVGPCIGEMYGNLFHHTAVDGARKANVKFIINAVCDVHKQNIAFVAGDLEKAHEAGVSICEEACSIPIDEPYDVIVASTGGVPRDINLYQAQKALSTAETIGKQGSVFILVAECSDGYGDGAFQSWMFEANTPDDILLRFEKFGFTVGGNKAVLFARALNKGRVIIVSDKLDGKTLNDMMLESSADLQAVVNEAIQATGTKRMAVLPKAVSMIPVVKSC